MFGAISVEKKGCTKNNQAHFFPVKKIHQKSIPVFRSRLKFFWGKVFFNQKLKKEQAINCFKILKLSIEEHSINCLFEQKKEFLK